MAHGTVTRLPITGWGRMIQLVWHAPGNQLGWVTSAVPVVPATPLP